MTSIFCPVDCRYLNQNEEQQNENFYKTGHRGLHECMKFNTRVYHKSYHPRLLKCEECFKKCNELNKY